MARVSSASEDAFHFKGSFADGWGEVVSAKALIFQFPPAKEDSGFRKAGTQDPPALYAAVEIQRYTDGDFGTQGAPETEEVLLSIQKPDKMTGQMSQLHPGNYPDGDIAAEAVDCGGALGCEGNTLFAMADGFQLNDKTKWMSFARSLEEKGFKPAVLKPSYFPCLVGLRAYFKTETRKKFRDDQPSDPTVFVVTEIKQFPYEKRQDGGKKESAKGRTAASAQPKPATAEGAAGAAGGGSGSAEDIAIAIILTTLAPAKKGITLNDEKKLRVEALMAMNKHKPAVPNELKKAVQEQMTAEWIMATAVGNDLIDVANDGKITFK